MVVDSVARKYGSRPHKEGRYRRQINNDGSIEKKIKIHFSLPIFLQHLLRYRTKSISVVLFFCNHNCYFNSVLIILSK